jgi:hypothetical protein
VEHFIVHERAIFEEKPITLERARKVEQFNKKERAKIDGKIILSERATT